MENLVDITNNKLSFNNRNVLIVLDEENNPWFKAKDIAEILEYKDTKDAIKKHIDNNDKYECIYIVLEEGERLPPLNLQKPTIFINESGLYSLILGSKKEKTKKFKNWITKEVLPSVRKHGEYKLQKVKDLLCIECNNKI